MRWIIGITLLIIIAIVGWFWYPRLVPSEVTSPYGLLQESTWMTLELDDTSDVRQLLDSSAALRDLTLMTQWPIRKATTIDFKLLLFAYDDGLGVIGKDIPDWIHASAFPNQQSEGGYAIWTTSPFDLNTKKAWNYDLVKTEGIRVIIKANAILEQYATSLSAHLLKTIAQEGDNNLKIEFEILDDGNIMKANGIAAIDGDQTLRSEDMHLLKYLPSQSGIALILHSDSASYAMAHASNGLSDDQYQFLYLFSEQLDFERPQEDPQSYRGVPLSIESVADQFLDMDIPWANEAYTAHLGDVVVQASSFEALGRWIDDYLADDKLINSPYYRQLEGTISAAGFTLYIRPDVLSDQNPFIHTDGEWPGTNSFVFQTFSELPGQKFFTFTMLHHRDIVDEAPIVWTSLLDAEISGGPWPFENHYNDEPEFVIQDADHTLYLINKDGKVLWRKKLGSKISSSMQMVDVYGNNKYQMLCATENRIHLIDRKGNNVPGFPIKTTKTAGYPELIRYTSKDDARILFTDGNVLKNVDEEGNSVKGWTSPSLASGLAESCRHFSFNGKDYIVARTKTGAVHFLDRRGKARMSSIQLDTQMLELTFVEGRSISSCKYAGHDTLGNLYEHTFGGDVSKTNVLPLGKEVGVVRTPESEHTWVAIKNDRIISLDADLNVSLDFLLPEFLEPHARLIYPSNEWIGVQSAERDLYYVMDLNGSILDKMPLAGRGNAIVKDLEGDGSLELIIPDGQREIRAYKLAD